jgi:hypothetical protein
MGSEDEEEDEHEERMWLRGLCGDASIQAALAARRRRLRPLPQRKPHRFAVHVQDDIIVAEFLEADGNDAQLRLD